MLHAGFGSGAASAQQQDCPEPQSWQYEGVDTSFQRERRFAGLSTSMRSHGRVRVDDGTVLWETLAPIEMVLRIDRDGLAQSVAGGPLEAVAGGPRGNAEPARLITALLSGDMASATEHFAIEQRQDPSSGHWHVVLQPSDDGLAGVVQRIEMTGCEHIEMVVIDQPNGDQDRVVFGAAD
ncbi:MAG: hypothetical protein AAF637_19790 [Pseudomonadota bacterium]